MPAEHASGPTGSAARRAWGTCSGPGRPGDAISCLGHGPEHTHDVEEVLLVTAGECTITTDGRPETARVGDAVIVTPGTRHTIEHRGGQPCQVVAVLASADVQIGVVT